MNITLHNLGRRFDQQWIFRNIDYTFSTSKKYAILGPNGSGKSTLLKTIAGQLSASAGRVGYLSAGREIHVDDIYQHLVFAAPYVELIEEFTLREMIDFHFKFKPLLKGFDKAAVISYLAMESASYKQIRYFSSGMKQRLKLALSCFSASEILLLDEPTSNLDEEGDRWYLDLINLTCGEDRLLIIGSNQKKEYDFCDEFIRVMDYK